MPLPPLRDRIHEAKRAARVSRLTDRRMTREAAERAVAAWEAEAASRGLSRESTTYWDEGEGWILARKW